MECLFGMKRSPSLWLISLLAVTSVEFDCEGFASWNSASTLETQQMRLLLLSMLSAGKFQINIFIFSSHSLLLSQLVLKLLRVLEWSNLNNVLYLVNLLKTIKNSGGYSHVSTLGWTWLCPSWMVLNESTVGYKKFWRYLRSPFSSWKLIMKHRQSNTEWAFMLIILGKTQFRVVGPVCTCDECQKEDSITFPVCLLQRFW